MHAESSPHGESPEAVQKSSAPLPTAAFYARRSFRSKDTGSWRRLTARPDRPAAASGTAGTR